MAIPIATLVSLFTTLGNIWLKLTEHTIKAENNPKLQKGIDKHYDVQERVLKDIDALEISEDQKSELKRHVTTAINDTVKIFNENGVFKK